MKWARLAAVFVVGVGCTCHRPVDDVPRPTPEWLAGTLPARDGGTPRTGGTLTVRLAIEPTGLTRIHDAMLEGTMVRSFVGTVYETLGRLDAMHPSGPLRPWLASSWREEDEGRTTRITLRPGVTFHDGARFTSADVKAVLDVVMNADNPTVSMRSQFSDFDVVETPAEDTVVIRWKRASVTGPRVLLGALPMMPKAALEGAFDTLPIHRSPVGTGPFRFVNWDTGQSISLARNTAYWGRPAHLETLRFRYVRDDVAAVQLWERGEFDVMTRIPPAKWRALEQPTRENTWAIRGYDRVLFRDNAYSWVGWNEARPMFADARVRRALAMLYPADAASRLVDLGLEPRATCPYLHGSPSCDTSLQPLPNDVVRAKALLDAAGWRDADGDGIREREGQPFTFLFLAAASSTKLGLLLPLFQESVRAAGIDMRIETIDAAQYVGRLKRHDFDAASLSWATADAVTDLYQVFHSSQRDGGSNYVGYASAEVDALLERIRVERDDTTRAALERTVHQRLFDDQVYLFLTIRPALDAISTRVHGLQPTLSGYTFADAWVDP